jgi:prolyl oligopeptidase
MKRTLTLALSLFTLLSCASTNETTRDAAPAVEADTVATVAAAYWDAIMHRYPEWATSTGDHRFDDRMTEMGPGPRAKWRETILTLKARAEKLPEGEGQERLTRALLIRQLDEGVAMIDAGFDTWDVDQMSGPQATWPYFFSKEHPMKTAEDARNLAARYRAIPSYIDGHLADLKDGFHSGKVAPRIVVDRVINQLDDLLNAKDGVVFVKVAERVPAGNDELKAEIANLAKTTVMPALEKYRDFLEDKYREKAREEVGLSAMSGGREAYALLAKHHTTTSLTPEQIHEIGKKEIERIEGEMRKLAKERGHKGDVRSFLDALRKDEKFLTDSRDELFNTFGAALKRADAALPKAFGRLPKLGYKVEPMDAEREKDAPAAYYQPGSVADGREGIFVANLYAPRTRPTFNSEVLAFHEAVPGHHLQIALAQEVEGLPRFRQEGGTTAFVEGWGLYSERLSDELGLYSSLEARVGYLGYAAWRASRLVVDTGMHHMGWSREQAVDYLAAHTTLGETDVNNEIDRYIVMPGQALAYMIGCLRILELRAHAEKTLDEAFSLPAFHDAVLGDGALPLALLDENVSRKLGIPPPAR